MTATSIQRIATRALGEARYIPRTIGLVWESSRGWTVAWLVLLLVQGLLPAGAVYLTARVVDRLLVAMNSGTGLTGNPSLLGNAALLVVVMALQMLAAAAMRCVRFVQSARLQDHISRRIHDKSVTVRMSFYDFADYYDHLHRARDDAAYRPMSLLEGTGGMLQNGVTAVGVSAVLLPFAWWLPMALLLAMMPSVAMVLRTSLVRRDWERKATARVRRTWYFDYLVTARQTAAEIRLFDLGGRCSESYQMLRAALTRERFGLLRREVASELAAALLGTALAAAAIGVVVSQAIQGRLTAGALAMFIAAFLQAQWVMRALLQSAGEVYSNGLFLGNLFAFLDLESEPEPVIRCRPESGRLWQGIRFESVSFTYPGGSSKAVSNLTLHVPAGQTVAIVGPNGSGKSTIVKLLSRFYEPDAGYITIDGVDIRGYAPTELRRRLSVLFQEPVRYSDSVAANVFPHPPSQLSASSIAPALQASGADEIVARLPDGQETVLGREFADGTELSGGEWQRIALARAIHRDAPILLLDEPTSAQDPWAEAAWADRLAAAHERRTTVIITHRFTTAMRADIIHVMDQGHIVESGSHHALLALGGRYAAAWSRHSAGERAASSIASA